MMRNYWYVSLSNRYPQPNENDLVRVVQSVQIKKKYSIIEMTREADSKRNRQIQPSLLWTWVF